MILEGENPTAMAKTTGLGVIELSNVFHKLHVLIIESIVDIIVLHLRLLTS